MIFELSSLKFLRTNHQSLGFLSVWISDKLQAMIYIINDRYETQLTAFAKTLQRLMNTIIVKVWQTPWTMNAQKLLILRSPLPPCSMQSPNSGECSRHIPLYSDFTAFQNEHIVDFKWRILALATRWQRLGSQSKNHHGTVRCYLLDVNVEMHTSCPHDFIPHILYSLALHCVTPVNNLQQETSDKLESLENP